MNHREELLTKMLEGYESLETFSNSLKLSLSQKLKLWMQKRAVGAYRTFVLPFKKKRIQQFKDGLQQLQDIRIDIPDHGLHAGPDNHYLSPEELEAFKEKGFLKPFRVLSPQEAAALRDQAYAAHDRDFDGHLYIGQEAKDALQRHNQWSINKSGLFQALSMRSLRDVLRKPAIAQRMASILGPDVICWRTQFIEKNPGDSGTFWHQNSAFQESSKARKLTPTQDISLPILQLTCWIALTDVTVENGAMRILPGSFKDGRLESYYEFAATHLMDFLALLDSKHLDMAIKAANFAAYEFTKAQAIFMAAIDQFTNIFDGMEVRDLTMKAGEAAIFTSLNMHASHGNTTRDQTRLAFIGRYTANSVQVYHNMPQDTYPTAEGRKPFSTEPIASIQVHGQDKFRHNRIFQEADQPEALSPIGARS